VGGEFGDRVLPGVAYVFFGAEGESACLLDSLRLFFWGRCFLGACLPPGKTLGCGV
jgi:hypothetical protein